jgi:hypothetical protein
MNIAVIGGAIGHAKSCFVRVGKKIENDECEEDNAAEQHGHEPGKRINSISGLSGHRCHKIDILFLLPHWQSRYAQ